MKLKMSLLQPPPEIFCSNRTSVIQPPKDPESFSLKSETITGWNMQIPVGNDTDEVRYRTIFYSQVCSLDFK